MPLTPAPSGITPGDALFTRGVGVLGACIRHASQSPYGHCGVAHELLWADPTSGVEVWKTAEAFADGLRYRVRTFAPAPVDAQWRFLAVAVTDRPVLRQLMLDRSAYLVATQQGYDFRELARILARMVGVKVDAVDADPSRHICSGHVSVTIDAAGDLFESYSDVPLHGRWPGFVRELAGMLPTAREIRGMVPVGDAVRFDETHWAR